MTTTPSSDPSPFAAPLREQLESFVLDPDDTIYLHVQRELAQHCGHADILREQVVAARPAGERQDA